MKQKSLAINALLNSAMNILNLVFPLITFPYVSRILNVDSIGKYNFGYSVNSYFLLIAALGIGTYAIREGAKFRDNRSEISQFISEVFTINLLSTLLSYILLFFSIYFIPSFYNYRDVVLIFSVEIVFTSIGVEWIYTIFEDYAYITFRNIIFKVISLICVFIFVKSQNDYLVYALITVFSTVGSTILNYLHAKKYCDIRIVFKFNWKKRLIPILTIFGYNVSIMIFVNSDIILLGVMQSAYIVGIYAVSAKIYSIVKTGLSAVLVVTIPRLSMLYGKKYYNRYIKLFREIFNDLIILVLPAVTGLFWMSKDIILLISGYKYIRADSSLKILSLALLFSIFSWLFNDCVLIPAKKERISLIATIVSASINILLNIVLIGKWQENAAAFSTFVAEFLGCIISCHFGLKIVNLKQLVNISFINQSVIGCFLISFECFCVKLLNFNYISELIFSVVLSISTYFLTLLLFKNYFLIKIIDKIKEKCF